MSEMQVVSRQTFTKIPYGQRRSRRMVRPESF